MSHAVYQIIATETTTLFAATQTGLRVSRNGGQSWRSAYERLNPPQPIPTFAILASADAERVIAGIPGGILHSADAGQTWQVALLPEPAPVVSALAWADDGNLLVGTAEDGVFRSADDGRTWETWAFGLLDNQINCLAAGADGWFYAGTESGVFVSQTGGRSWRETPFPMEAAPVISLAVTSNRELLAGTVAAGLWRGREGGRVWELSPLSTGAVEGIFQADENGDGRWFIIHDGALAGSTDHGRHWSASGPFGGPVTAFTLLADGRGIVGLADGQLLLVDKMSFS